jgi:hypothetical protein
MDHLASFAPLFLLRYTVGNTDMQESPRLRKWKLIEEIRRYRHTLPVMKFANQRAAASPAKEAIASRNQEIAKKLRSMENELHELNVQLIREEMSGGSFGGAPRASSSDEPSSR